jgi:hypothetical protein
VTFTVVTVLKDVLLESAGSGGDLGKGGGNGQERSRESPYFYPQHELKQRVDQLQVT